MAEFEIGASVSGIVCYIVILLLLQVKLSAVRL